MPTVLQEDDGMDTEGEGEEYTEGEGEIEEPELSTPEERDRFYQEVRCCMFLPVRARQDMACSS